MLYERVDVYRRGPRDGEAFVYRCFKLLPGEGFVVQSADRISHPPVEKQMEEHEARFVELFVEEAPEERSTCYRTLEEAIGAFDQDFEGAKGA